MNWSGLNHGGSGLLFGYLLTGVPMLVAMIQRQAPIARLLLTPLFAIPATATALLTWTGVHYLWERISGVPPGVFPYLIGGIFIAFFGYAVGMLWGVRIPHIQRNRGTHIE
jgi:hypothetical protein